PGLHGSAGRSRDNPPMPDAPVASLDPQPPTPAPPAPAAPSAASGWRPAWPELAGLAVPAAGALVLAVVLSARHAGGLDGAGRAAPPDGRISRGRAVSWRAASWLAALAVVLCIGLISALMTRTDTIYGNNPDAHQVVGIAVLLQHVAPAGTDNALPIDTVPPS